MTEAQDTPASAGASPATKELPERVVSTEHRLAVGKKTLDDTATCGTVLLRDCDNRTEADMSLITDAKADGKRNGDKARAQFFFIAYTLKGVKKPESRPLTFSFNGGPGSSSVWLHLGILGPRRVVTDELESTNIMSRLARPHFPKPLSPA